MGTEIWLLMGLVLVLVGVIIHQQIFFTKQIQRLVDKLMSRDFTTYVQATKPPPPRVMLPIGEPEDLSALNEFATI